MRIVVPNGLISN